MTDETERASLYTRPKSGIALPETGMNTPRMVIALPKTGIAPPEMGIHTPRMVIALPEKVIAPPEMGMNTPRMVIAPPETGIAPPKPVIRTPGTHPLHPATHRHTYIYLIHLSLRHPRTIRHTASQSFN